MTINGKWVLILQVGEDFKETIMTYVVHSGMSLTMIKNDKTRVRVVCKKGFQMKKHGQ